MQGKNYLISFNLIKSFIKHINCIVCIEIQSLLKHRSIDEALEFTIDSFCLKKYYKVKSGTIEGIDVRSVECERKTITQ